MGNPEASVLEYKVDYILPYIDFNQKEIQSLWYETTGVQIQELARNYTYLDLELTIKLILKNLPFINKLYITCKDVQQFPIEVQRLIDASNGKIIRVNESEFMPNNYITFSSACIEMFIWRIPGLSDYFRYSNDDMLPLKPLTIGHFFNNKVPIQYLEYGRNGLESIYDLHLSNATNLVLNRYQSNDDYKSTYYPRHTLRPMLKRVCQECYNKYKKFIDSSLTPLRCYNNLNFDFFLIYALNNNLLVNKPIDYNFQYIDSTDIKGLQTIYNNMQLGMYNNVPHIVCINDGACSKDKIDQIKNICDNIMSKSLIRTV